MAINRHFVKLKIHSVKSNETNLTLTTSDTVGIMYGKKCILIYTVLNVLPYVLLVTISYSLTLSSLSWNIQDYLLT